MYTAGMRRRLVLAIVVAVVVLVGGTFILAVRRSVAGPIYPVAAVQAGLQRDPGGWLGRAVRVRSSIPFNSTLDPDMLGGASCPTATAYLLLAIPGSGPGQEAVVPPEGPLPLIVPGCADPLLTPLRRIPLLSGLLPRAQV